MASDDMKHRRLQELGESDFEIVDGQPDIRGWDVKNSEGAKIGEVEELILDAQLRKVRYMVVDLDDSDLDIDDDKRVLVPIGLAQLNKDEDDVIVPNITVDQLNSLPEYDEDQLTPDVERTISIIFGRTPTGSNVSAGTEHDTQFYNHEHFNEENLYRLRLPDSTNSSNPGALNAERTLRFNDRMGQSGSEVEGYLGSTTGNERAGAYRSERVEDETAVPVNRSSLDDAEELRIDRDSDDDILDSDERSDRQNAPDGPGIY
jgi:sporulation protein YlmC with PRC-barrel domain